MSALLHRGRLAKAPQVVGVRALTREDLAQLAGPRPAQNRPKVLREQHHRLARYVASGMPTGQVLAITGYSTSRFSVLSRDPAFQELVSTYREKVTEAHLEQVDEFAETSISNMRRAERQIEEHLDAADESGELLPLKTLLALTSDRADRFGYGKHSTQRNEVVNFAAVMEQIAKRSGRSNVIDASADYSEAKQIAPPLAGEGE